VGLIVALMVNVLKIAEFAEWGLVVEVEYCWLW